MLNELIKSVAKKANITESAASIAVNMVIKALKDSLPQTIDLSLKNLTGAATSVSASKATAKTVKPAAKTVKPAAKTVKPVAKTVKPAAKATKPATKKTKKDDPLGNLGGLVGSALGGLLGKK